MRLTIIGASLVQRLLSMPACINVLDKAMRAASSGGMSIPPRLVAPLADASGFLLLMPGSSLDPAVYGAKVISLHPDNPARGRPPIQGFVMLFEHISGSPVAIIEAGELTAIRTAAASGLATRELARDEAKTHGILGAGVQAGTHIDAIAAVRDIELVCVWARDPGKGRRFAERHAARTGLDIVAVRGPQDAAACDIVSVVTGSDEPVLKGRWLPSGCHVNLVGAHSPTSREADTETIEKASVYVDLLESARNEAGDLLIPIAEGRFSEAAIVGELGHLLNGQIVGRRDRHQITLYKSLGIVAQDLFAAHFVFENARRQGLGTELSLDRQRQR